MLNYPIHQRVFFDTCPLDTPVSPATYFDLPHLGVLEVKGENALPFLQGQLTCDVNQIKPGEALQGALCNLKGRIIALIDILLSEGKVFLVLPVDLIEIVLKDLKLASQLSRVTLEKTALQCDGYYGPALPGYFHLTEALYLRLRHCEECNDEAIQKRGNLPWHKLCLEKKRFSIYPETSGQFLPEPLSLDKTNTVSFTKGCYKGQEIIARMHYKGSHKYHLESCIYESEKPVLPGQSIAEGEVVDLVPLTSHQFLLNISLP